MFCYKKGFGPSNNVEFLVLKIFIILLINEKTIQINYNQLDIISYDISLVCYHYATVNGAQITKNSIYVTTKICHID